MGFIMDGLDAEAYDRSYDDRELVRRIGSYFRPELTRMSLVGFVVLLNALADTALPVFLSQLLDDMQLAPETFNVVSASIILAMIASLSWVFNFARRRLSSEAVGNVTLKLREDAFDAVTKRDMSFYDQYPSGKIVSRVTSDTQAFSSVVDLTINFFSQILLVGMLILYLFTVNVRLTLVLIAIAPLIVFTALQFRRIARTTVTNSRRILATVNSQVQETVSGIGVAKTFRREQMLYDEFMDINDQSYRINLLTGFTFSSIFPILTTLAGLGTAAIVWFGVNLAEGGVLTAGEWFLFIQGMGMFWFPLTSIASFWSQFPIGSGSRGTCVCSA